MEKCVNCECGNFDDELDNNCDYYDSLVSCHQSKIGEFAEISVDELTEMREKLDRQTAFIKALFIEKPCGTKVCNVLGSAPSISNHIISRNTST